MNSANGQDSADHFGQRLAHGRAGNFTFSHWRSRSEGDRVEPHGHDDAHFMFIVGGAFHTQAGGEVTGPFLLFNPAGTYHQDHFLSGGLFFSVSMPNDDARIAERLSKRQAPSRVAEDGAFITLSRLMKECRSDPDDSGLAAESLCYELLGVLEKGEERQKPKWLSCACAIMREDAQDRSLAELARFVGVHPIHFTRTFRRFFNCTPGEYRRTVRAQRAALALTADLKSSAASVAASCGYADHAHLTRSFRRVFGITPSAYRRMACG